MFYIWEVYFNVLQGQIPCEYGMRAIWFKENVSGSKNLTGLFRRGRILTTEIKRRMQSM